MGQFVGSYKVYSASTVVGKLIEEYGLAEFFEEYGVEFSYETDPSYVNPGGTITLNPANSYAWVEPVANYEQSYMLSFYGGLYEDA